MRRKSCRKNSTGLYFAAFGLGMLIAMLCPKSVIVGILSLAIVFLGIIVSK